MPHLASVLYPWLSGIIKEKYLKLGIEEFSKRLSKYCKLDMIELDDEKCPESLSEKDMLIVKDKEGKKEIKVP